MRLAVGLLLELVKAAAVALLAFCSVELLYRVVVFAFPDGGALSLVEIDQLTMNMPARIALAASALVLVVYALGRIIVLWRRRRRGVVPAAGTPRASLKALAAYAALILVTAGASWALTAPLVERATRELPNGLVPGVYSCLGEQFILGIADEERIYLYDEPAYAAYRYDPIRRVISITSELATMPLFRRDVTLRYVPKGEPSWVPGHTGPGIETVTNVRVMPNQQIARPQIDRSWCPLVLGARVALTERGTVISPAGLTSRP